MEVIVNEVNPEDLGRIMPWPAANANKYTRGRLVAVGGSAAYPGAISLAAGAALRMGSGYVEVVCAPGSLPVVQGAALDAVARSWEGWRPAHARLDVAADGRHPQACLVGPGIDPADDGTRGLVLAILGECAAPVVVDGGAIATLAEDEGRELARWRHDHALVTVVTPHYGEAARLGRPLSVEPPQVPCARWAEDAAYARRIAEAYGVTVVLKGPDTFVADPASAIVDVMDCGTAALAKAGSGDVLAGMLGSLLSQGLLARNAANLAASLHALAAQAAASELTEIGVRATDLAAYLPCAIRRLSPGAREGAVQQP